ncbi:LytR family transcriptional regulator [Streptococcus hongkongensis]|nr:LytR family transcriptional regulator [Streptococcus uberis]
MTELNETIGILLDVYAYNHAYHIASKTPNISKDAQFLIALLKERRELNLDFLYSHQADVKRIEETYQFPLVMNSDMVDEQLANYILDLEVKVKNGEIIDFVRSVSPILYRLFLRLVTFQIPDFASYIIDTKNDDYDTWNFDAMYQAHLPIFDLYLAKRQNRNITSRSLTDIIQLSNLPDDIKETVEGLRKFEKSVRNPLAHLIKPFDEEELYRTTRFSSQTFLDNIIDLATYAGVNYQRTPFYFDRLNAIIEEQLDIK